MSDNIDPASQLQPQQQQTSPFSKLTPDLRSLIYEKVVAYDYRIHLRCECCRHHHKHALQPPLTRTCREIRAETLRIFYGRNQFVVNVDASPGLFERWLGAIGEHNRELFRELWMCKAAWDRWAKLVMPEPIRAGPVAALLRVLGEGEYGTHKLMRLGFVDVQYEEDGLQGHGNCWEEVNVEESADVDRYGDLEQQAHVFKPKAHSLEAEVDFDEDGDAEEYADVEANAGIEEAA